MNRIVNRVPTLHRPLAEGASLQECIDWAENRWPALGGVLSIIIDVAMTTVINAALGINPGKSVHEEVWKSLPLERPHVPSSESRVQGGEQA
ncbi:hypothetical protein [Gordonia insulae]|uniref:Uncharacterized protein n=1 Tax=Gordonia insulae TaxID=2420509 RepID=A0A3G8JE33_9ACTN|nr:hypothetical protein [Gordonia insulae]AZG43461.1 hypothetical protein D7316_00025 [Gordonia insulae]